MRRAVAAVAAVALAMSACSVPDRYLPKLLPGETIARVRGVVALAVGPKHATYYALANGEVYSLAIRPTKLIAHFTTTRLDSIAFSPNGLLYAAFLSAQGVSVAAWKDGASDTVIETTVEAKGEIAFDTDGRLLLGIGDRIIDTQGQVISDGWRAPQVVPGRGHRLWVADNAPGDDKELVARGREKSVVKRRRFASALPLRTDPSDLALLKDELLVCSEHYGTVYRLHIGLDDVARRRSALKNVKCRNAIVISPDNSVITATEDAILRYGAR